MLYKGKIFPARERKIPAYINYLKKEKISWVKAFLIDVEEDEVSASFYVIVLPYAFLVAVELGAFLVHPRPFSLGVSSKGDAHIFQEHIHAVQ